MLLFGCGRVEDTSDGSFSTGLLPYYLAISFTGDGSGSVEVTALDGSYEFYSSSIILEVFASPVTLEAMPASGEAFDWWDCDFLSGAATLDATATVPMNADRVISVKFAD